MSIVAKRLADQDATWYGDIGLSPGHIVLDGDPTPPPRKRDKSSPPLFGPCLLWPNGRPSQQLLSSYAKLIHRT